MTHWKRGEAHPKAKLTVEQVIEIKRLLPYEKSNKKIAELFGVTAPTIGKIRYGENWAWVKVGAASGANFRLIPFVPNDPPVSGWDRDNGRSGVAWEHSCGRKGSMTTAAIRIGWTPYCTACNIGQYDGPEWEDCEGKETK